MKKEKILVGIIIILSILNIVNLVIVIDSGKKDTKLHDELKEKIEIRNDAENKLITKFLAQADTIAMLRDSIQILEEQIQEYEKQ